MRSHSETNTDQHHRLPGDPAQGIPITALSGFHKVPPGTIESSGTELDTEVHLQGTVHTYDWKMLFDLLDVDRAEPLDTWIQEYHDERNKRLVTRMFEYFPERKYSYDHRVAVHVEEDVTVKLTIGFVTLRLEHGKETKDFVLCTAANVAAMTAEGTRYPIVVL